LSIFHLPHGQEQTTDGRTTDEKQLRFNNPELRGFRENSGPGT
jgi:hypothetical protein